MSVSTSIAMLGGIDCIIYLIPRVFINKKNRLIPVYIAVLAFVSTIIVHMGSGPNWFNMKFIAANCRRVWWQHLLLITNFVPKGANEQVCYSFKFYKLHWLRS